MAIIKVIQENYDTLHDVSNLIKYVLDPTKREMNICGSRYLYLYNNTIYTAKEITDINTYYGKIQGNIVKHLIISYPYLERQCTPQMAEYAIKQMMDINLPGFPYIYAFHEDTNNPHFHIVFGTVNLYSGMKYPEKKESIYGIAETLSYYSTFIDSDSRKKNIIYDIIYEKPKK